MKTAKHLPPFAYRLGMKVRVDFPAGFYLHGTIVSISDYRVVYPDATMATQGAVVYWEKKQPCELITPELAWKMSTENYVSFDMMRPRLRSLIEMTEADYRACYRLWMGTEYDDCDGQYTATIEMDGWDTAHGSILQLQMGNPHLVDYLISAGFDVHSYLEQGLAVEFTSLTAETL